MRMSDEISKLMTQPVLASYASKMLIWRWWRGLVRGLNNAVEPVKTEVVYFNKDHKISPVEKAFWIVTLGYDETGELVFESWGEVENEQASSLVNECNLTTNL